MQYNSENLILIEAAVQMSIPQRWQSVKWAKGNHRRTERLGRAIRGVIGKTYDTPAKMQRRYYKVYFMSF